MIDREFKNIEILGLNISELNLINLPITFKSSKFLNLSLFKLFTIVSNSFIDNLIFDIN